MNPEIKSLWLSALRSGDYKQGQGMLRTRDNTYCCLGVLTDLYIKFHPESKWEESRGGQFGVQNGEGDNAEQIQDSVCPARVVSWAKLPDANPTMESGSSLSEYNDGEVLNDDDEYEALAFDVIADLIEAEL